MPGTDPPWIAELSEGSRAFAARIFSGVAALCSDYLADLDAKRIEPEAKIVQDSLWGFIAFSAAEMVLVDSPLVQRLRAIRQLGFAHLLFPNAGYSRFEHSLGVCHVIGEFAAQLEEKSPRASGTLSTTVAPHDIEVLRFAALLHDVGHIAFSHTAERCIEHYEGFGVFCTELRQKLKRYGPREMPAAAELLAICICSSPTVKRLLSFGRVGTQVDTAIEQICRAIIGAPQSASKMFLAEMLSGDMDADKLDYIPRDCMVTGVPLPFDVKRLILKTRLARGHGSDPQNAPVRLAVSFTGARALMDLTVSRMMLREKIYRHQKVMAAESMFENALTTAARVNPRLITPENLLECDDETLLTKLGQIEGDTPDAVSVRTLVQWIKRRRLLKRAFVFSAHFISANTNGAQDHPSPRTDNIRLLKFATREDQKRGMRTYILAELHKICELLQSPDLCPQSEEYLAIVPAKMTSGAGGSQLQPWVVDGQDTLIDNALDWQHLVSNVEWANAHEAAEALTYVFCPPETRVHCYVATRNVLAHRYGLIFKKPALLLAKISQSEVAELDRRLLEAQPTPEARNAYRDTLILSADTGGNLDLAKLEPLKLNVSPTVVRLLDTHHERVSEKLGKTSQFQGFGGHQVSLLLLSIWLSQFADEDQRDALELFLATRFLDRQEFVAALKQGVETLEPELLEKFDLHLAPLTSSGDFMAYYAGDLPKFPHINGSVQHRSVSEAVEKAKDNPKAALLIMDDVLGSGTQISDVLRVWFREPPLSEPANISSPLTDEQAKWLLDGKCPIVFVFAYAMQEGIDVLAGELARRKINAKIVARYVSAKAKGVFGSDNTLYTDRAGRRESFKAVCLDLGLQLLKKRADQKGWDTSERQRRALGYGEAGQLVATSYNCPTMTLPVLWAEGEVDGKPWTPLFRRRFRK